MVIAFNALLIFFGIWYLYNAHLAKQKYRKELHEERSLEYSWTLFDIGFGAAVMSRMEAIIKSTDIRTKHSEESPYTHIFRKCEIDDLVQWELNPETGYIKIRESGIPGDNANRLEVYRKQNHRPLVIACYYKNQLEWLVTTEDLPYFIVRNHNYFLEKLLDVWSKYCTEKSFTKAIAAATVASIETEDTRE